MCFLFIHLFSLSFLIPFQIIFSPSVYQSLLTKVLSCSRKSRIHLSSGKRKTPNISFRADYRFLKSVVFGKEICHHSIGLHIYFWIIKMRSYFIPRQRRLKNIMFVVVKASWVIGVELHSSLLQIEW